MNRRSFFISSILALSVSALFFCSYTPQASAFSIGSFNFGNVDSSSWPSWLKNLFGIGNSAPCTTDPADNAPAVLQTVSGYTPGALLQQYPVPGGGTGRAPGVFDIIKEAWYPDMISPGECGRNDPNCLSADFPTPQGTHIEAITAKSEITNVVPSKDVLIFPPNLVDQTLNAQNAIDLVSFNKTDACGVRVTRWGYVADKSSVLTSSQTLVVPKNTPVDVSYQCQPNQELHWRTDRPCAVIFGVKIGHCDVRDHIRTFLFSNEFSTNIGTPSQNLTGKLTLVADGTQNYNLSCGGYRQENGSATSPQPPVHNFKTSSGGVCIFGIDCNTGGDSGIYGVADPNYQHPGLALTVTSCSSDDDIVINNVCTPCQTIKSGSHRSGNICIINSPPKETIDAGAGDGVAVTVSLGSNVPITATYTAGQGDTLSATAINDNATGNSVSCTNVMPSSTTCWQQPDPQKVYTYIPSVLGTKTFSAQVKTQAYTNYNSNKSVSVTAICPAGSVPNGHSSCTCTTPNYTWVGNSCVLSCPANMVPSGGVCINAPALPALDNVLFTASRVRSGSPSTLSFSIPGMVAGIVCSVAPVPQSGQIVWNNLATWSGTAQTGPITGPTVYTLSCTNSIDTVHKDVTVQLVPDYQEI